MVKPKHQLINQSTVNAITILGVAVACIGIGSTEPPFSFSWFCLFIAGIALLIMGGCELAFEPLK